jgi:L-lactate utilization protein LutC
VSVIVIGVDPGESTGVAELRDGEFIYAGQTDPEDAVLAIEVLLEHCKPEDTVTVACEQYVDRGGYRTNQPTAQQMVGVVRAIAEKYGVAFVLQTASEAHGIADAALLKKLGMWVHRGDVARSDANDANMAVRHALLALAHKHASIFEKIMREIA